ncbi:MAG: LysM peptidoglycan-binding domain-containing protein, partial [Flavobacteriales bacterium]
MKIKKEYPHLIDTAELFIHNADKLSSFYQKLDSLSKGQKKKLKIFHIGNSHIQADFLTGRMRTLFHKKYGNGGRGTIFPYKLAGTNGPDDIKINSNIAWNAQRNVFPKKPFKTGISGITLVSKKKEFFLEVGLKKSDSLNNKFAKGILFHNISTKENPFDFYISTDSGISEAVKPKRKVFHHKIQKGESLSTIASKNNVTVMQLKRWNDLDKNNIYAGEKLKYYKVADKNNSTISNDLKKLKPKKIKWKASGFMEFKLKKPQNSIILRYKAPKKAELNGIYLENNNPGLVYSMIGVNGAKFEHYNKSEKFFPQFDQLNKDLVIIALGTNEALDRNYTKEKIRKHMKTFYTKLKNSTDAD